MISDKKDIEKRELFTQANREAWNEAMPKHQAVKKEYWDEQFKKPGRHILFMRNILLS